MLWWVTWLDPLFFKDLGRKKHFSFFLPYILETFGWNMVFRYYCYYMGLYLSCIVNNIKPKQKARKNLLWHKYIDLQLPKMTTASGFFSCNASSFWSHKKVKMYWIGIRPKRSIVLVKEKTSIIILNGIFFPKRKAPRFPRLNLYQIYYKRHYTTYSK